jgi:beta-xylosidase
MGVDSNGDGIGEPVTTYRKPAIAGKNEIQVPQTSDEFEGTSTGLQWQWNANPAPEWMFHGGPLGFMRLYCILLRSGHVNHWTTPHLFLQKFPAPEFTATTRLTFHLRQEGDRSGLMVMGMDYSEISVTMKDGGLYVGHSICSGAMQGAKERLVEEYPVESKEIWLRVSVTEGAVCTFGYSLDGKKFREMQNAFKALEGRWIGARLGLFASSTQRTNDKGYADFDWFRIE